MTTRELLLCLSAYLPTAPLVAVWASEEVVVFEDEEDDLPFVLRSLTYDYITSISVGRGCGPLRLHAEGHDQRTAARTCRGVVTAGQLVEILGAGSDSAVMVICSGDATRIEAVASVCAHQEIQGEGGESGYEYEFGDSGRVRINCESAAP